MITRSATVIAALLLPALASAEVFLERLAWPGYTAEAYAVQGSCTISDDGQLAISYRAGADLQSSRVQQLQLKFAPLRAAIANAARGDITTEPMPVDGPTLIYRAWRTLADGSRSEVLIWEENGGAGQRRINEAPAAVKLRNFLDLNCGELPRP